MENRRELATIDMVIQESSGGQVESYVGKLELWVDGICVHHLTYGPYPSEEEAYNKTKAAFDRADERNRVVSGFVRMIEGHYA